MGRQRHHLPPCVVGIANTWDHHHFNVQHTTTATAARSRSSMFQFLEFVVQQEGGGTGSTGDTHRERFCHVFFFGGF